MQAGRQHRFYKAFASLLFAILIGRLAQLQLYSGEEYYSESERNRVRDVQLEAPRGQILDRNGKILVDSRPAYSVSVIPYEFLKSDQALTLLSSILGLEPDALNTKIREEKISNFSPVRVKRQINYKELSDIEERRLDLPGVFYGIEPRRYYPGGVKAPHLFGYLGEITSGELEKVNPSHYRAGDSIGKSGIELKYESDLRGSAGVKFVEVDVLGREVRELEELGGQPPVSGHNLYMTIDARLQQYLEKRMADKKGAAVILDPRNGDVLAIVSEPDYEPELFSKPLTPEIWSSLVNHEQKPLYNRASLSLYPPGSTYKLVVVAAGLETGTINPEDRVVCRGSYRLGRRSFKCWKKEGHGSVNLLEAIQGSCNVYFYQKGLDVGLGNWSRFSRVFRFGSKTGIDLPNESAGLVPDSAYFDAKYGPRGWTRGLLLNLSVGQGDLLTTPLQMAWFAMVLGNEGVGYEPRLVKKIIDPVSGRAILDRPVRVEINGVSAPTYETIKEGMSRVVNAYPGGTGRAARLTGIEVCGKTGTAQNPHGKSHAWFIGFAPRENPEIAFCIMVENGGGGGAVAAPIAGGLLRLYFENQEVVLN